MSIRTKSISVTQTAAGGAVANIGASATFAWTSYYGGTPTFAFAGGGVQVTYDPVANGPCGGYVTITPGGSGQNTAGCVGRDLTPAVSFDFEDAVQVGVATTASETPALFGGDAAQEAAAFEAGLNVPAGQLPNVNTLSMDGGAFQKAAALSLIIANTSACSPNIGGYYVQIDPTVATWQLVSQSIALSGGTYLWYDSGLIVRWTAPAATGPWTPQNGATGTPTTTLYAIPTDASITADTQAGAAAAITAAGLPVVASGQLPQVQSMQTSTTQLVVTGTGLDNYGNSVNGTYTWNGSKYVNGIWDIESGGGVDYALFITGNDIPAFHTTTGILGPYTNAGGSGSMTVAWLTVPAPTDVSITADAAAALAAAAAAGTIATPTNITGGTITNTQQIGGQVPVQTAGKLWTLDGSGNPLATSSQAAAILAAVEAIPPGGLTTAQATQLANLAARFCGTQGKVVIDMVAETITVYEVDGATVLFQQSFTVAPTTQTLEPA